MNYSEDHAGYHKLWGEYQSKVLKKLHDIKVDPHPQAILWTSTLTEPHLVDKYLHPDDYIIQIWASKNNPSIKVLIDKNFRIIFSNYDELYLDCGYATQFKINMRNSMTKGDDLVNLFIYIFLIQRTFLGGA